MILNFPPLEDQSPTIICLWSFLRKSFILTYRAFAIIFALYNKFQKLNKIMLEMLRVLFPPNNTPVTLADRRKSE